MHEAIRSRGLLVLALLLLAMAFSEQALAADMVSYTRSHIAQEA
jgi:hypothetical protein